MKKSAAILERLYCLRQFGIKLGLETMQELMRRLGNPEQNSQLRFIHIAGTNGKGSVAAMLEAILHVAGYSVGLYTSPHLVWFGERIRVNQQPLTDIELVELYEKIEPHIEEMVQQGFPRPTFFETTTALALMAFQQKKVNWIVWETGMGGRLDATNIVFPALSVIVSISFDHMKWLGDTLEQIAHEKAGIIKKEIPVVISKQVPEVERVLFKQAASMKSKIVVAKEEDIKRVTQSLTEQTILWRNQELNFGLIGKHQQTNLATVLAIIDELRTQGVQLPDESVSKGLKQVRWPGRMQLVNQKPLALVDGAHNTAGAKALVDTFTTLFTKQKANLIFGILRDKEIEKVITLLVPIARRVCLVPVQSERSADVQMLKQIFSGQDHLLPVTTYSHFSNAWTSIQHLEDPVIITGSLFLAGEALEYFQNLRTSKL